MVRKVEVPDLWLIENVPEAILGNKYSPVAVAIPHVYNADGSRCSFCTELLKKTAIEYGAALVAHVQGQIAVEFLAINIIANPNIRWVIVVGHESILNGGKALIYLHKYDVDPKTYRIRNLDSNIELVRARLEAIERFRAQVKVIDLLLPDGEESCNIELQEVQIGTRSFKIPVRIEERNGEKIYVIDRLTREHLPNILGFVIHCCLQEPENRVKVEIKGRYIHGIYEFYDPGTIEPLNYVEFARLVKPAHTYPSQANNKQQRCLVTAMLIPVRQ